MAAANYFDSVQKLYIAFYQRPADSGGLLYWSQRLDAAKGSLEGVVDAFATSAEANTLYGAVDKNTVGTVVDKIYQALFNRTPDEAGKKYYVDGFLAGKFTAGTIALDVLNGATNNDLVAINNKVTVANRFTETVDGRAITDDDFGVGTVFAATYAGDTDAQAAREILVGVTSNPATMLTVGDVAAQVQSKIADQGDAVAGQTSGKTFTLTAGIDNIIGTGGNDAIDATVVTATSPVLGGLDKVDGGAGTDTLNIADTAVAPSAPFALPAGFSISNVENVNVTTNGNIGATGAGNSFDLSGNAAVTSIKGVAAGTTGSFITASATANVDLTVAGTATATVTGGKAVAVTGGTGVTTITGKGLTSVTVKNGGDVTIDNLENTVDATSAKGTTLTAVTLDAVAGATAAVKGAALEVVTLQNQKSALAVNVTNDTSTKLDVNVNGVGYDATGAAVAVSVAAGSKAATVNLNATGAKSSVTVSGAVAKTLNITGDAALTLATPLATATKIDGSAATGNLALGTLNAATVDVKTGSGNDSLTATVATAKIAVDSGAGNDTVTLAGAALVAGSTVKLGAGNDKLIGTVAVVKAAAGATDSVIDGGDGVDTVSAALINAGNAALFQNFEGLSLNSVTGLDAALLTGSTISALSIDSVTTDALYQNLSVASTLDVSYVGDNSAFTNTLSFKDATGAADTFAIKFSADNSAAASALTSANVQAGTIAAAGVENFTIESGGTKAWNSIILGADSSAKTVIVTGAANLNLAFASGFGNTTAPATSVSSIDGSAATGKLAINIANVTAATAGLTVVGGSAADTLTTSTFSSKLTGGAGADEFNVAATLIANVDTTFKFTTITDAAATDSIVFADKGTEVFTSTKVDVSSATALIGGTTNALDLALAGDGGTNGAIKWFQYAGDTYVVQDLTAGATAAATDIVVKLTGLIDLSTASFDATTSILTLA